MPRDDLNRWLHALKLLRTHDISCPRCSYSLRGNTNGRCPECGEDFNPIALTDAAPRDAVQVAAVWYTYLIDAVLVFNTLALFGFQFRRLRGEAAMYEAIILIALVIAGCTWKAAALERSSTTLLDSRSGPDVALCIFSLGLYRLRFAELWSPPLIVCLTLLHVAYVLLAERS